MANEVKVFDNLKVKEENGQVLFDAESAAYGIGLTQTKKGILYVRWERVNNLLKNSPRVGKGDYLTEPQFYRLATKADSPQAEKFQDWVTSEVLPSIRKTGNYSMKKLTSTEMLKLQNDSILEVSERVGLVEDELVEIKDNQPVNATDYGAIGAAVSHRVHQYAALHHIGKSKRGELFKDLNRQIKEITGAGNRSRIKSKDYDMVIDFIENWGPTSATKLLIEQEQMA